MKSRFEFINNILRYEYLLIVTIVLWLFWLWKRRSFYKFCWNFPTWWGFPIVGVLPKLKHVDYLFPKIENAFETENTDNLVLWTGLYPLLATRDVNFIDFILSKREFLEKASSLYHAVLDAFQGGLVPNPVKKWAQTRPLMEPLFSRETLLSLFPSFNKQRLAMIAKLDASVDDPKQSVNTVINSTIFELTMQTTMGSRSTKDKKAFNELFESFVQGAVSVVVKIFASFFNLEWLFSFYKLKEIRSCQKFVNEVVKKYIEEEPKNETANASSSKIFIRHAVNLYKNKQFTWDDIIAESYNLFAAAYETTSFTIFSTLAMMAMHPDVQEQVYEELRSTFSDPNCNISYEDVNKLSYLDKVIKETLRLLPPVPVIGRHIVQDTKYEEWSAVIPKDIQVVIFIYHLHRHPGIWGPDANEFRPSRFSDENMTTEQRKAFIPFSKGFRNCIGNRYAQLALKVIIAGTVMNFKFETDFKYKDLEVTSHVSMHLIKEPHLTIKRRNNKLFSVQQR